MSAALISYLGRAAPPDGTVAISFCPPGQYVALDPATVAALHLVRGPSGRRAGSVLEGLDTTRSAVGAAWLRTALLQPLAHAPSLRLRHAAVAELVGEPLLGVDVDAALASLPRELGKLYGWMALRPVAAAGGGRRGGRGRRGGADAPTTTPPPSRIAGLARALALLRAAVVGLPALATALTAARAELLRAAGATLAHPAVVALGPALDSVLAPPPEDDGEGGADGGGNAAHFSISHQDCFTVRVDAGADGVTKSPSFITPVDAALLAAAREALTAAAAGAAALVGAYRAAAGPAARHLRLHHAQRRGFYVTLSIRGSSASPPFSAAVAALPADLTITHTRGSTCVELTSAELGAANARAKAAAEDCLALSAVALSRAAAAVTTGSAGAALQKAVDAVALVDGLASLARAASSCPVPAVAPTIASAGCATVLAGLRDPLLLAAASAAGLDGGTTVRPNDACFSPGGAALAIIAGPNSAGKSTYLRSVGAAIILAHVGAHLPATHASVGLVKRVSVCGGGGGGEGGGGGCLETGGSALGVEARGIAAALHGADPTTLILLDEPGRATSTADGAALAWAVAETALAARAPTLVATHFPRLARLARLYPTARAYHMGADVVDGEHGGLSTRTTSGGGDVVGAAVPLPPADLTFTWRLRPGPCTTPHYGLAIAPHAGMPPAIVSEAAAIAARIEADQAGGGGDAGQQPPDANNPHAADHALHLVAHRLATLANAWVGGAADADVAVALAGLKGAARAAVAEQQEQAAGA